MSLLINLEDQLFSRVTFDLGWAAIVACGVQREEEVENYLRQINYLCQQIFPKIVSSNPIDRAKAIFDWLWTKKPRRYKYQGNFKLTEVLKAQLGEEEAVGNCLGLTLLYNVLCQRFGLKVKAGYVDEAFGLGPHVFSILITKPKIIDVENILPYGFDYPGHINNPGRQEWGDRELIADIYLSIGNDLFERGDLVKAIESYDKALKLNPKYAKASYNKGLALIKLGRVEEAKIYLSFNPSSVKKS